MEASKGVCAVADAGGSAVAFGSNLAFLSSGFEQIQAAQTPHTATITGVALSSNGELAASVGDDKLVAVWERKTGALLFKRLLAKKPTCVAFAALETEQVLLVGDKTGDVLAFPVPDVNQRSKVLLGHTASIITGLLMAAEGKLLVTADRDEKIRVSQFPQTSSIHAYCLGHSEFITCLAVSAQSPVVFSGSGDGTVAAWNYLTGEREASFVVSSLVKPEANESSSAANGAEEKKEEGKKEQDGKKKDSELTCTPSSLVLVDEKREGSDETSTETALALTIRQHAIGCMLSYSRSARQFVAVSQTPLPAPSAASMVVPVDATQKLVCMLLPAPHFVSCLQWQSAEFGVAQDGSSSKEHETRLAGVLKGAFGADAASSQESKANGASAGAGAGAGAGEDEDRGGYKKKRIKSDYWDRPLSANVKATKK